MVEKYKVVCLLCNHVMGIFDKPDIEVPIKCDKCDGRKISTVKFTPNEVEQMDFDIVIYNKRTGNSKTCGFFISKENMIKSKKDLNKMRRLIATEMATALHTIISSDVLLVDLLGGGDIHEI